MTSHSLELEVALLEYLQHEHASEGQVRVEALLPLAGGFSRDNWSFDMVVDRGGDEHRCPLVMRRDPTGSLLLTDRAVEYSVLEAVSSTSVPAPQPRYLDHDGSWFGRPTLIMERLTGVCDYTILNGPLPLPDRKHLGEGFLAMLCDIQDIDLQGTGLSSFLSEPENLEAGRRELDFWAAELARVQLEPLPELDLVHGWLRQRAVPARKLVLVHGDFKPGNALVEGVEISAILDWETAHIGDPLEDLGWITNPVRRAEHQIPGEWESAQIVAAYRERTLYCFDADELRWWNVFSNWKLAIIILTGLRAFVDGELDRAHQLPTWLLRAMLTMVAET